MSAYRIYELTADDHVAAPPTIVDCADDGAAIEKAKQRLDRRIIEVWQVDRCVIRIQPIAERRRHGFRGLLRLRWRSLPRAAAR